MEGTTTQQMREAPDGAFYVWSNGRLYYPERLAHEMRLVGGIYGL